MTSARAWLLLFAGLAAALSAALFRVVRANEALREELHVLARAKARAGGLDLGDRLAPVRLRDVSGESVALDLEDGTIGTLLLIHASGCDACAATGPRWLAAVESAGRPDVRVVCVQTDGEERPLLALEGLPASLAVPLPPAGWLATIPAIPATLLVDERGRLVWSDYGELDARGQQELVTALEGIGAAPVPSPGR